MITLKKIKAVNTIDDLNLLGLGNVHCDISHRGGGIGFSDYSIAEHFNLPEYYFPRYFGASCNYLGGGIRGNISPSGYNTQILNSPRKAKLLNELALACVRAYEDIENRSNLNDEVDENGETNWEAMGTRAARKNNINSAY